MHSHARVVHWGQSNAAAFPFAQILAAGAPLGRSAGLLGDPGLGRLAVQKLSLDRRSAPGGHRAGGRSCSQEVSSETHHVSRSDSHVHERGGVTVDHGVLRAARDVVANHLREGPTLSAASHALRRRRTAAVVLAGFCAFLALYAPQPLLPMLAAAFGQSAAAVSFVVKRPTMPAAVSCVVTVSTIAVAVSAPLAGAVADRLGRRRAIVWAAFLVAAPTLLAATARSFGQLLFWRCLQGFFTPGIFAITVAYINEEWDEGGGAAMAAYVTGTVLGGFCGRTISALVAAHSSWRWSFFFLGILNALGAVAIRAWLPSGRRLASASHGVSTARAMARHLRNPRLLATYAVGFCVFFTLLTTFTYVNFYLAAPPFRLSTAALGWLFVVYLADAAITPFAGRAIDRLGHRFALTAAFLGEP